MKYKSLIVLAVFLCATVAVTPSMGHQNEEQKCKIIPADVSQVRIFESHDWRLYHAALNHTKSDKIIKIKATET